jgi:L-rhamnose mutarotase
MAAKVMNRLTRVLPGGQVLTVDQWGRVEIGKVTVDRDYDENSAKRLWNELHLPSDGFLDFEADGIKLQACADECLVQVGNFGIMQNKERVLYGRIEDHEFSSCTAVFDKKKQRWATTVAFQMQTIEENKAKQKVAKELQEVFHNFRKLQTENKCQKKDGQLRGGQVDQNHSGLLHFPPSFFCSSVDTENGQNADKLQAVEHPIRFSHYNDKLNESRPSARSMVTEEKYTQGSHYQSKISTKRTCLAKTNSAQDAYGSKTHRTNTAIQDLHKGNKFFFKASVTKIDRQGGKTQRSGGEAKWEHHSMGTATTSRSRESSKSILKKHLSFNQSSTRPSSFNQEPNFSVAQTPQESLEKTETVRVRCFLENDQKSPSKTQITGLTKRSNRHQPVETKVIYSEKEPDPQKLVKSESKCSIPTYESHQVMSLRRPLSSNLTKVKKISSGRSNQPSRMQSRDGKKTKAEPPKPSLSISACTDAGAINVELKPETIGISSVIESQGRTTENLADLVVQMESRIDELLVDMMHSSLDESRSRSRVHSANNSSKKHRSARDSFERMTADLASPQHVSKTDPNLPVQPSPVFPQLFDKLTLVPFEAEITAESSIELSRSVKDAEAGGIDSSLEACQPRIAVAPCLLQCRLEKASRSRRDRRRAEPVSRPQSTLSRLNRELEQSKAVKIESKRSLLEQDLILVEDLSQSKTLEVAPKTSSVSKSHQRSSARKKAAPQQAQKESVLQQSPSKGVQSQARSLLATKQTSSKKQEQKAEDRSCSFHEDSEANVEDEAKIEQIQEKAAAILQKYRAKTSRTEEKKTVRWSTENTYHPSPKDSRSEAIKRSQSTGILTLGQNKFTKKELISDCSIKMGEPLKEDEDTSPFFRRLMANLSGFQVLPLQGGWQEVSYKAMQLPHSSSIGKLWASLQAIGLRNLQECGRCLIDTYPYQLWAHLDQLLRG